MMNLVDSEDGTATSPPGYSVEAAEENQVLNSVVYNRALSSPGTSTIEHNLNARHQHMHPSSLADFLAHVHPYQ